MCVWMIKINTKPMTLVSTHFVTKGVTAHKPIKNCINTVHEKIKF